MHDEITTRTLAEPAMGVLAEALALKLRPGDVVSLMGDLGAGKTTFARALIRGWAGDRTLEVPSPTFAIVQNYETARGMLAHFDWYRLSDADDLDEIGFDDALNAQRISLVEWPERCEAALPATRIDVSFAEAPDRPAARRIAITATGPAHDRVARAIEIFDFVAAALDVAQDGPVATGRADPAQPMITHLQGDASARAYANLTTGDGQAMILMDSPAMADGPPVRDGKPYSQLVHLAESMSPFIAIAGALRDAKLAAPDIITADPDRGLAIVEDLGHRVFDAFTDRGDDQAALWTAAIDVLVALRSRPPAPTVSAAAPNADGTHVSVAHALPRFDRDAFITEAALYADWAHPALTGAEITHTARTAFEDAWSAAFDALPADAEADGIMLRDYHSPNLIWRPERAGTDRVGLLDFQDALAGPWAYDVVSLCQDARVDVPPALEAQLKAHYVRAVTAAGLPFASADFEAAYAICGAQRATKIIGIFHRLAARDQKPRYLKHLPRVAHALARNLAHPALAPVADWFAISRAADALMAKDGRPV